MPLTVAHPAAVIPFRVACPRYLSWSALIIGTLCPDFDYFLGLSSRSGAGHTLSGSLSFCLPLGLMLYALFHGVVKRPAALLLPRRDQGCVWNQVIAKSAFSLRSVLVVGASIVLGAWTHLAWDALSHAGSWGPRNFPFLNSILLEVAGYHFTVYRAVQHGSTVLGLLCLLGFYLSWRRVGPVGVEKIPCLSLRTRLIFVAILLLLPLIGASAFATITTPAVESFLGFRDWLGAFAVSILSFGGLTLVAVSAALGLLENRLT